MLGGIIFQMGECKLKIHFSHSPEWCIPATIAIYVICAGEFFVRYLNNAPLRPGAGKALDGSTRGSLYPRLKLMSIAMVFNTTCLFIRCVSSMAWLMKLNLTLICYSIVLYTGSLS